MDPEISDSPTVDASCRDAACSRDQGHYGNVDARASSSSILSTDAPMPPESAVDNQDAGASLYGWPDSLLGTYALRIRFFGQDATLDQ